MVKILVVDDDLEIRDFLTRFLEENDYEVFSANDGNAALAVVKEKKPNIILLDIAMPGPSGIKTLQLIKEIDKNAKVIMITGVEEKSIIELATKYGASDYITKPFSLEHLEKDVLPKILKQLI